MYSAARIPLAAGSRSSRLMTLVVMAWLLVAFNGFHLRSHTLTPALAERAPVGASLSAPAATWAATVVEEACAFCVWRTQTPYTPPSLAALAPRPVAIADLLPPSLPSLSGGVFGILRTRAPPSRLS